MCSPTPRKLRPESCRGFERRCACGPPPLTTQTHVGGSRSTRRLSNHAMAHGVSAAPSLALERRFPVLAGRLPRRPLAALPTPVHRLAALGGDAGVADLWIKRDDRTGEPYGGNKVRKLEWLLADALARGHRTVLTTGALG